MSLGSLLSWALCGLVVGLIARFLVPGQQSMGLFLTTVLGIIGAFVGGALFWFIWGPTGQPFSLSGNAWHGWLMAIVGAALVLWLWTALDLQERWLQ